MLSSPFDFAGSLHVGTVIFVSPDEIKVQLEIDAPESVALNAVTPRVFPRINSYLLIPSEAGYLVGQVEWITVENSPYPKRKGLQDFGLIDLPFPMRKLCLTPLGILQKNTDSTFEFRRGIEAFPSVGDEVLFPTEEQIRAIVTSGKNLRVTIGTSPLAGNADVKVDPDRLFGRHIAVLGNTGSGKSCSVAGLIRWSLASAMKESKKDNTNSRFIIFDPNAEYVHAFQDIKLCVTRKIHHFSVVPQDSFQRQLHVPLWMWNNAEWDALVQASERTQKPLLKRALAETKFDEADHKEEIELHARLSVFATKLNSLIQSGDCYEAWKSGQVFKAFFIDLLKYRMQYPSFGIKLQEIEALVEPLIQNPYKKDENNFKGAYPETTIRPVLEKVQALMASLAGHDFKSAGDEDVPRKFRIDTFITHLNQLIDVDRNPQYYDSLLLRLNAIVNNARLRLVIDGEDVSLCSWIESFLGDAKQEIITIIDLSLLPSEMIHLITAILSRIIFESLQRYRKINKKTLPTVLVLEEAHSFIQKYNPDLENPNAATLCCKTFEKIAREGRKFGLGLVLSSQRPSELSPTVLSQCNTFLLHRISNDRDQELVHRLLPDNLQGLLRELPTLPSRNAILLGWASELPVLVRMRELPMHQRPQSDDPDFWDVWTGIQSRTVDWNVIADDWQGNNRELEDNPVNTTHDSVAVENITLPGDKDDAANQEQEW